MYRGRLGKADEWFLSERLGLNLDAIKNYVHKVVHGNRKTLEVKPTEYDYKQFPESKIKREYKKARRTYREDISLMVKGSDPNNPKIVVRENGVVRPANSIDMKRFLKHLPKDTGSLWKLHGDMQSAYHMNELTRALTPSEDPQYGIILPLTARGYFIYKSIESRNIREEFPEIFATISPIKLDGNDEIAEETDAPRSNLPLLTEDIEDSTDVADDEMDETELFPGYDYGSMYVLEKD